MRSIEIQQAQSIRLSISVNCCDSRVPLRFGFLFSFFIFYFFALLKECGRGHVYKLIKFLFFSPAFILFYFSLCVIRQSEKKKMLRKLKKGLSSSRNLDNVIPFARVHCSCKARALLSKTNLVTTTWIKYNRLCIVIYNYHRMFMPLPNSFILIFVACHSFFFRLFTLPLLIS